jgi:regulator of sirC expression with transglutaminase-like and TPR domain
VWAELGQRDAAAADLQTYLEQRPGADDAGAIGERLADLRRAASTPRLQ